MTSGRPERPGGPAHRLRGNDRSRLRLPRPLRAVQPARDEDVRHSSRHPQRLQVPRFEIARIDPLLVLPGGDVARRTRSIAKATARPRGGVPGDRVRTASRAGAPVAAGDQGVGRQAAQRPGERQRRAVAALDREQRSVAVASAGRASTTARSIATRPGSAAPSAAISSSPAERRPRTRARTSASARQRGRRSRIARQPSATAGVTRPSPGRRGSARHRTRRAPSAPPGGAARTRRGRRRPTAARPASRSPKIARIDGPKTSPRSRSIARTVRWK